MKTLGNNIKELSTFIMETTFAEPSYFIYARTVDGAVFLSEDFDEHLTEKYLDIYKALVVYFNGGEIVLYKVDGYDYYPVEEFRL